jgi:hypothetical protein
VKSFEFLRVFRSFIKLTGFFRIKKINLVWFFFCCLLSVVFVSGNSTFVVVVPLVFLVFSLCVLACRCVESDFGAFVRREL